MPLISTFFGILIRMFYDDHSPPHFHAVYNEYELVVCISPISFLRGDAPNRVRSMVTEWAAIHQEELLENWGNLRDGKPPFKIDPLE